MSEWQSVLKSTSIEKQTSNEAMDKFIEGLGKVMQEYEKERVTNQPTTATQPTQPTTPQTPAQAQMARLTQKPASGYKSFTSEEVRQLKAGGFPDKTIKEMDKNRAQTLQDITSAGATTGTTVRQQPIGQKLTNIGEKTSQVVAAGKKKVKDIGQKARQVLSGGTQLRTSKEPFTGRLKTQSEKEWQKKLKKPIAGQSPTTQVTQGDENQPPSTQVTKPTGKNIPTGKEMRGDTKGTGFFGKEPASTQRRGGTRINPRAREEAEKRRQERWPLTGIRGQGKK